MNHTYVRQYHVEGTHKQNNNKNGYGSRSSSHKVESNQGEGGYREEGPERKNNVHSRGENSGSKATQFTLLSGYEHEWKPV